MYHAFRITFLSVFYFFCCYQAYSQDTIPKIKVYFLYGSRPAAGCVNEKHLFGGIHGGHVSIGIDSTIIGFHHLQGIHILPHKRNYDGSYECVSLRDFARDTVAKQYATIEVPLSLSQYKKLKDLYSEYLHQTPYDYAFFGMRCTAAAYDVLSRIDLFAPKGNVRNVISNFYPRKLRKHFYKIAREKQFLVTIKPGSRTRRWEKD